MTRSAPTLFADLSHVLAEYVILQVCKVTDAAQDIKKNDNHTIAFLIQHYGLDANPAVAELDHRMQGFRQSVLPARHKLISHADRDAVMAGDPLGGATKAEWDQFWNDLNEFVGIVHEHVLAEPFSILDVGGLSDAEGLLKSLRFAEALEVLLEDKSPQVANRAAEWRWLEHRILKLNRRGFREGAVRDSLLLGGDLRWRRPIPWICGSA